MNKSPKILIALLASLLILIICGTVVLLSLSTPDSTKKRRIKPIIDNRILTFLTENLKKQVSQAKATNVAKLRKELGNNKKIDIGLPNSPCVEKFTAVEIYKEKKPGVLIIGGLCKSKTGRIFTVAASGFALTKDGIGVTNYHVIAKKGKDLLALAVMTSNEKVYPISKILVADKVNDVAIFQIDAQLTPLALSEGTATGSKINILSHPNYHFYSLSEGIISRYYQVRSDGFDVLRMAVSANFAPGSSGAPIFDDCGRVIGMVRALEKVSGEDTKNSSDMFNSCVPAKSILNLIGSK